MSRGQRLRAALLCGAAAPLTSVAALAAAAALAIPTAALGSPPPPLAVRAAALLEAGTGQTLYGLRAGGRLPIASTTKIMTALIALKHVRGLARCSPRPPSSWPRSIRRSGCSRGSG